MTLVGSTSSLKGICGPDALLCSVNADASVHHSTEEHGWNMAPITVACEKVTAVTVNFSLLSSFTI